MVHLPVPVPCVRSHLTGDQRSCWVKKKDCASSACVRVCECAACWCARLERSPPAAVAYSLAARVQGCHRLADGPPVSAPLPDGRTHRPLPSPLICNGFLCRSRQLPRTADFTLAPPHACPSPPLLSPRRAADDAI